MINLAFIACVGCFDSERKDIIIPTESVQSSKDDWSCSVNWNKPVWTSDSPPESIIKINTYDCEMTKASVYVTKNDGKHLHYQLQKVEGCEWKIMLMLTNATCNDIKNISIVQEYSEVE